MCIRPIPLIYSRALILILPSLCPVSVSYSVSDPFNQLQIYYNVTHLKKKQNFSLDATCPFAYFLIFLPSVEKVVCTHHLYFFNLLLTGFFSYFYLLTPPWLRLPPSFQIQWSVFVLTLLVPSAAFKVADYFFLLTDVSKIVFAR